MRWPPTSVWPLAGQANSSFLPPSACPSRSQKIATPRPTTRSQSDAGHVPRGRRAVSFCSGYDARACASVPPQNCPHSCRPQCQSHLWPSLLRARPYGLPRRGRLLSPLKPRPGAAHSRPEVRTARPPRPDTPAARLRALSSARTASGWTRMAGPAETRRLAAEGKRPPAAKASRPAQDLVTVARRQTNRARQIDFASFGAVMKDAKRAEAQRAVIYSAAETTPAPASQDPRCGCTVHNARCAHSPVGSVTVSAGLLPGPQGQPAVTAPVPPASLTPAPHSAGLIS